MSNNPSRTPARCSHRQERLEHILSDEVQWLIREEARDAALAGVRVVSVSLSPDGGHARIGYAVEARLNQESEAEHRLPILLWGRAVPEGALAQLERLVPRHLGTLGGGNHFIELDRDAGGDLWLLVHSGSRGLGAAVAAHHLKAAEAQGQGELPGLSVEAEAGRACLADVGWALSFAQANRHQLVREAAEVVAAATGVRPDEASRLDVVHNFVREEEHFGRRLLVHRKGAVAAEAGKRLLIPGSMGTASYLVEGLGEPRSFRSCSHGAGRVLTRKEARRNVTPHQLAQAMRRVVYDERRERDLVEEAPCAYRDICEVLEDEADLVRPVLRLVPIAVLKG